MDIIRHGGGVIIGIPDGTIRGTMGIMDIMDIMDIMIPGTMARMDLRIIMVGTIPGITAVGMAGITVATMADITVVTPMVIIIIVTITTGILLHTIGMAARENELAPQSTGALHRKREGHIALLSVPLPI